MWLPTKWTRSHAARSFDCSPIILGPRSIRIFCINAWLLDTYMCLFLIYDYYLCRWPSSASLLRWSESSGNDSEWLRFGFAIVTVTTFDITLKCIYDENKYRRPRWSRNHFVYDAHVIDAVRRSSIVHHSQSVDHSWPFFYNYHLPINRWLSHFCLLH